VWWENKLYKPVAVQKEDRKNNSGYGILRKIKA
jgi:hypothetical protein